MRLTGAADVEPLDPDRMISPLAEDSPFWRAQDQARMASARRIAEVFPSEFALLKDEAQPTTPVVGMVRDAHLLADTDPWTMIEEGISRWQRCDWEGPIGMALEAAGRSDASEALLPSALGHDPLPVRPLGRLVSFLDDGYVLALHGAADRHQHLQFLFEDLERALGVAVVETAYLGLRTAIGALPERSVYRRIMIQLEGRRHVSISKEDDESGHVTVGAGTAVLVPRGYVVRHRPLDESTVHLELTLTQPDDDESEPDRVWPAWLPARGHGRLDLMTRALVTQDWDGVLITAALPGGLFTVDGAIDRFAGGGFEFGLSPKWTDDFARLLGPEPQPGGSVPRELGETLLRAGILRLQSAN